MIGDMARPMADREIDVGSVRDDGREVMLARLASGAVLGAIAVAAAFVGGWTYNALVAVASVLMAYEWDRLCAGPSFGPFALVHAAAVAMAVGLTAADRVGLALLAVAMAAVLTAIFARGGGRDPRFIAGGLVYIAVPAVAAVWLRADQDWGRLAVLGLFAVVWATDTGAYFTGKAIGGPRLAPLISPGKTWAGLLGGTAAAVIAALLVGTVSGLQPMWLVALAGALLSLLGQIGDLGKSKVKRHFHVKDSGNLIPGHGGIIDRLDSTLATMPILALVLTLWL